MKPPILAEHKVVFGNSGGGKTTYMREEHATHDGISIWVNHTIEKEDIPGVTCNSLTDMVTLVRACDSLSQVRNLRIDYRPSKRGTMATEEPKEFGRLVSKEFNNKVETQIVGDECQHLLPDDEKRSSVNNGNPSAWIMHQGRSLRIKGVFGTQDPTETYYPPLKQTDRIVWCGKAKIFEKGFFNVFKIDPSLLPDKNLHYVVIDPTIPIQIVDEGTTKAKYA